MPFDKCVQSDVELMQFGTLKMMLAQQLRAEADLQVSWDNIGLKPMDIPKVLFLPQERKGSSHRGTIVSCTDMAPE